MKILRAHAGPTELETSGVILMYRKRKNRWLRDSHMQICFQKEFIVRDLVGKTAGNKASESVFCCALYQPSNEVVVIIAI